MRRTYRFSRRIFVCIAACCSSCGQPPPPAAASQPAQKERSIGEVAAHRIIFSNSCLHAFSDPGTPDSFRVQLTGLTIRGGQVTIDIITADGRNIYHESFAAYELLSDVENLPPKQEDDHIRQRIAHFFDKEAFESPAMGRNEVFDGDYVNKDDWEDIHSNRSAIGFHFLRGSEYDLFIAYSHKKRKAVPYAACC